MPFGELFSTVRRVDTTGSTNADLLADESAEHLTLLIADYQSAGRGRLGRTWTAPAGTQLIFSVLLRVTPPAEFGTLTLAAGLAVTDAIEPAVLKWPNDVLVGGRKLCGILAEAQQASDGSFRVVIGVGINHLLDREQLPVDHATSLALEGIDMTRAELEEKVFSNLHRRLEQWRASDPQLMADYRAACSSIGMDVRLDTPTGVVNGTVEKVLDDGRIRINGETYSAGDVTHLRPAQ